MNSSLFVVVNKLIVTGIIGGFVVAGKYSGAVLQPRYIPPPITAGGVVVVKQPDSNEMNSNDQETLTTDAPVAQPSPSPSVATSTKANKKTTTTTSTSEPAISPGNTQPTQPGSPAPAEPQPTTPPSEPDPTPPPVVYTYRNGIYSYTASYSSPGGPDQLGVQINVQNDIITSSTVTNMAGNATSSSYQNNFIGSYGSSVNGMPLKDLSLSRVAGASLTTNAFNNALTQIRAAAAI